MTKIRRIADKYIKWYPTYLSHPLQYFFFCAIGYTFAIWPYYWVGIFLLSIVLIFESAPLVAMIILSFFATPPERKFETPQEELKNMAKHIFGREMWEAIGFIIVITIITAFIAATLTVVFHVQIEAGSPRHFALLWAIIFTIPVFNLLWGKLFKREKK